MLNWNLSGAHIATDIDATIEIVSEAMRSMTPLPR